MSTTTSNQTPYPATATTYPLRFHLVREVDASGTSGKGLVAEGVRFTGGTCVVRWLTPTPSTAVYDSIEAVEAIHGHGGATRVRWLDVDLGASPGADTPDPDDATPVAAAAFLAEAAAHAADTAKLAAHEGLTQNVTNAFTALYAIAVLGLAVLPGRTRAVATARLRDGEFGAGLATSGRVLSGMYASGELTTINADVTVRLARAYYLEATVEPGYRRFLGSHYIAATRWRAPNLPLAVRARFGAVREDDR